MTIVQPGKVPTYSPSPEVSLSGYTDSDRTRFLFNTSQFVKARLAVTRPSFGYVRLVGNGATSSTWYINYKTLDGKYALVNGEKYVPVATGAPSTSYPHSVVIGFPTQVTTSSIVLWSTSHLDCYPYFRVYYTYDSPTGSPYYFEATVSSITETYDADIQRYEGEVPPSGLYKYTITLGETYSARYFKIEPTRTATVTTQVEYGQNTINVDSTAGFPSYWAVTTDGFYTHNYNRTTIYTGKTSTAFTGVSIPATYLGAPAYLSAGSVVFYAYKFAHLLTEVDVIETASPILELWNTNGTPASPQELDDDYYYDIAYDNSKGMYYTIRYNESIAGTAGASFVDGDDFDDSSPSFNTIRWEESEDFPNFVHNTSSGTVEYSVSASPGRLITNYYIDGDYDTSIYTGFNNIVSTGASFHIGAIDRTNNNVFLQMGVRGPWVLDGDKSGWWEAIHIRKLSDSSGGTAEVHNLRVDTKYLPKGSEQFSLTYVSSSDTWTVQSGTSGGYLQEVSPGEDYTCGPISLNMVHTGTPLNGVQIVLDANYQDTPLPSTTGWWWGIGVTKSGTDYYCKYDTGSGMTSMVSFTDSLDLQSKFELFADGDSDTIDLSMDDFVVSGGSSYFENIHVFSIEAVNSAGQVTVVPGYTDAEGYLIKRLDVINYNAEYNAFIGGRVQITTDSSASGAVYVKVNGDLLKFNKSQFPMDLVREADAALYKESVIPETGAEAFSYSAYSKGNLNYVEYDDAREGTYLKTMSTTTISGTDYESFLDVTTSDYPFAWDQNNFSVLYYIDGTSVKFYDMDEHDVAFCNAVSEDKVMPAGSSSTSTVTATVMNVYGEPLSAKSVAFTVSAGDGAISPASACTNASGIATSEYTVGSTVGISSITVTASDASC